jgi:hypothetical protein
MSVPREDVTGPTVSLPFPVGPPGGGRFQEKTMEASGAPTTSLRQPIPAEPLRWLDETTHPVAEAFDTDPRVEYIGRVRVPIAGPYRPWARLYRLPDGRRLWVVRLWDCHRAVRRIASTFALLEFARLNRFPALSARVRSLDGQGRSGP